MFRKNRWFLADFQHCEVSRGRVSPKLALIRASETLGYVQTIGYAKVRKTPPHCFAHLGVVAWIAFDDRLGSGGFGDRLMNFAPLKFFLFSCGAKLGQFRPTLTAQVVCGSSVDACQWCKIV
jgi:hypothetical protein